MPGVAPTVEIYRGDTTPFPTVRFRETPSGNVPGAPIDVTGWVFLAQWRPTPDSDTVLPLTLDLTGANAGWVYITASALITSQMGSGGVWDLQATKPDGTVQTQVRGKTKLVEDVSRG